MSTWGGRKGRTRLLVKDSLSRLKGELDAGSSSSNWQVPRGNTDSQRRILVVFPQPRGLPPPQETGSFLLRQGRGDALATGSCWVSKEQLSLREPPPPFHRISGCGPNPVKSGVPWAGLPGTSEHLFFMNT